MTKERLRPWVAVGILTAWVAAVFLAEPISRGLAAGVGIVLTWLFLRNGNHRVGS